MHTSVSVGGVDVDAIFDTGASGLTLDSSYFRHLAHEDSIRKGSAYYVSGDQRLACDIVQQEIDILLAGQVVCFEEFVLDNLQDRLGVLALVSIPENNKQVWHFDYGNKMLSVLDSIPGVLDTSTMAKSDIRRIKGDVFISLPFSLVNSIGDSLSCRIGGAFDTGSGKYLVAHGGLYVFENKETERFVARSKKLSKIGTRSELFYLEQIAPSLGKICIELDRRSHTAVLTFGNSLLAHYDFWLDFNSGRMYASAVEQYVSPFQDFFESRQLDFRTTLTNHGMLIDYCRPGTRSQAAGFREGDLIVKVDNKPYQQGITRKDIFEFEEGQAQHRVSIIRDSDTLSLYITPEATNTD